MALEKTEALVLRSIKFGETSRILTFLTRDFGRVKAIAKGARAARPRFGAALEPFARIDLVFYRKLQRDLHLVSQADLIDGYLPLSDDVRRYAFASAVVEFLSQVVSEEEASLPVYAESVAAVDLLSRSPVETLPYVLRAFQLRVVTALGHGPELFVCLSCGRPAEGAVALSALDGGVLCRSCARDQEGTIRIGAAALTVLRTYRQDPLIVASRQRLTPPVRAEVGRVVEAFLAAQFDSYRGLKSLRLAAELSG